VTRGGRGGFIRRPGCAGVCRSCRVQAAEGWPARPRSWRASRRLPGGGGGGCKKHRTREGPVQFAGRAAHAAWQGPSGRATAKAHGTTLGRKCKARARAVAPLCQTHWRRSELKADGACGVGVTEGEKGAPVSRHSTGCARVRGKGAPLEKSRVWGRLGWQGRSCRQQRPRPLGLRARACGRNAVTRAAAWRGHTDAGRRGNRIARQAARALPKASGRGGRLQAGAGPGARGGGGARAAPSRARAAAVPFIVWWRARRRWRVLLGRPRRLAGRGAEARAGPGRVPGGQEGSPKRAKVQFAPRKQRLWKPNYETRAGCGALRPPLTEGDRAGPRPMRRTHLVGGAAP
jgi:hypothetical protein